MALTEPQQAQIGHQSAQQADLGAQMASQTEEPQELLRAH